MEIRDPEFNRFFSEALKLLSTRRRFCEDFIFRGFVRVFLFSFLSFCFLSLSFFQTDFSFASESQPSSRSLSQGDACNKVLIKVGALEAEQRSAQQQSSASDLEDSEKYPWLGKRVRNGFWDNEANREKYMKWLGEKLKFSKPEDWYALTTKMIEENSGRGLLQQKFRGSPAEMVMALVEAPEGGWRPWEFKKGPNGLWDNEENQKAYMKWLGEKLGLSKPEDWYALTAKMIEENSGGGLLKKFNGSPAEMVTALVKAPEGDWLPWEFKGRVHHGFWDNEENQKAYMKWLGEKLGLSKPEDWYGLTKKMIIDNKGSGLLQKFNNSPAEMVMTILADQAPEGGWRPWLVGGSKIWDDKANQKAYMKWLGETLGYTKPEDWYEVTWDVIRENRGGGLLEKFRGSPAEMVMTILADQAPEGGWKKERFNDTSKMERRMRDILVRWFDGLSKPSFNDRRTHGLKFKKSGNGMEADVLFEDLKFAIEYHGEQHYEPIEKWGGQEELEIIQKRDQEKREAFKNAGYIYIEIPHYEWAGGDEVALKNLILEQLKEYKDSSDHEVKAQAWLIEEVLQKTTINEDNTTEDNVGEASASTNNESLPMIQPFGESDSSGSENGPAASSTATSPNTASGGR